MRHRIAFLNLPFSTVRLPSIALTQLQSVVRSTFDGRVDASVHYLNHDFADFLGWKTYSAIAESVMATVSGLGDWMFRLAAFPDLPDNADIYFARHSHSLGFDEETIDDLCEKRHRLSSCLSEAIDGYGLADCSVVGFTSMFAQNMANFAMARLLKERRPDIVTVIGGANCEAGMGKVIARNVDAIDFVFSGPALKSFPRLLGHVLDGEADACHRIAGVYSRRKLELNGSSAPEIGEELDIDIDVPLDYDGFLSSFDQHWPNREIRPSLLFETSRGCWWGERAHCTFCGLNGTTMKYRSMAPDKAVEQFQKLFRYSPGVDRFESVDNILPRSYLTDVLPRLETPEGATLFYEIKSDLKDHEMATLAAAGVTEVQPGIEALATSTLRLMRKGTTVFHNLRFLKSCVSYGIEPVWNLLIGFPGEAEDVYRKYAENLHLLTHLPPPTGAFPVRFDRFSPYFTQAREYGLSLRPYDFYGLVYPFQDRDLEEMAYFFVDENVDAAYMDAFVRWIRPLQEKIARWRSLRETGSGQLEPVLQIDVRHGERVVTDTRDGTRLEHRLTPVGFELLELLYEPHNVAGMQRKLPEIDDRAVRQELEALVERGLLFEEDGRYMSLIAEPAREEIEL